MLDDLVQLPLPSPAAVDELAVMGPHLLAHLEVTLSRHPELATDPLPVGPFMLRLMHRHMFDRLITQLRGDLRNQWIPGTAQLIRDHEEKGFSFDQLRIQLECWLLLLDEHLSVDTAAQIRPLFAWTLRHLGDLALLGDGEAA